MENLFKKILVIHMPAYNMTVPKMQEKQEEVTLQFKEVIPSDWSLVILPERETNEYKIEEVMLETSETI